jgi:hypothetical protein
LRLETHPISSLVEVRESDRGSPRPYLKVLRLNDGRTLWEPDEAWGEDKAAAMTGFTIGDFVTKYEGL